MPEKWHLPENIKVKKLLPSNNNVAVLTEDG